MLFKSMSKAALVGILFSFVIKSEAQALIARIAGSSNTPLVLLKVNIDGIGLRLKKANRLKGFSVPMK
jgi:hypothetical protein